MGYLIPIGLRTTISGRNTKPDNTYGLSSLLYNKLLFLWLGDFSDDNLRSKIDSNVITVNGKDFSTTYIPETSTATFNIPHGFITADTDSLWQTGGVVKNTTVAELIADDWDRTFIKYASPSPHDISIIAILKSDAVLTDADKDELTTYCQLYYLYFDEWNDLGYGKDNRES